MRLEWPKALSARDMREMLDLMNGVAVQERNLGFNEPLNDEDGLALMRAFDEELRRGAVRLLLVRGEGERVIGMVTLARAPQPGRRHVVDLRRCVIHPDHRGRFLDTGFAEALRATAEMGCDILTLEVRDDGPMRLWQRLGFQEYGRLHDYARKDGRSVTGYFMYARRADLEDHFRRTGRWSHRIDPAGEPAAGRVTGSGSAATGAANGSVVPGV
ncbi:GNAT family N-acetyltransferase [Micromonospora sp. NPDC049559]|uniref:GNAT family N-acetyltransferase n=1 Tax=Micromonospora sp. NPDC049559 TaxID=3155923 RepID=UPI00344A5BB0